MALTQIGETKDFCRKDTGKFVVMETEHLYNAQTRTDPVLHEKHKTMNL